MDIFLIFVLSAITVLLTVLNRLYTLSCPSGKYAYHMYLIFNATFACAVFGVMSGFRLILDMQLFICSLIYCGICCLSIFSQLLAVAKGTLANVALFSSIGTLLLPSLVGVIFRHEEVTVFTVFAHILLCGAIVIPYLVNRKSGVVTPKRVSFYYFLLMLTSGGGVVCAKYYAKIPHIAENSPSLFFWTNAMMFVIFTTHLLIRISASIAKDGSFAVPISDIKASVRIVAILYIAISTLFSNISSMLNLKILETVPVSTYSILQNSAVLVLSFIPALAFKEKIKKIDIVSIILAICGVILFFIQ